MIQKNKNLIFIIFVIVFIAIMWWAVTQEGEITPPIGNTPAALPL